MHENLVLDLLVRAEVLVLLITCRISLQTTSHSDHLFILNSFACIQFNNRAPHSLLVTVVDSFALHSLMYFLWKVCVEWRITNYFGCVCSKLLVFEGVPFSHAIIARPMEHLSIHPSIIFTATLHDSLLPFLFHYYPSAFTTTLQPSLLPFSFHYYPSAFTTTLQLSLLPFSLHYYPSAFTTTLQLSLLPFSLHYYPSAFTTTLQLSLLPFSLHYYPSAFTTTLQPSLLPFSLHYYPSAFTTTLQLSLLPFSFHYYPSAFTTTLHQSLPPLIIHCYSWS